jgi:hypothetical protein
MWWTPLGNRVLRGAEGRLFQQGLASLVQALDDCDGEHDAGVRVFDRLGYPERLAALEQAAQALLVEDVPAPELTAVLEGAVAAVYEGIKEEVEFEVANGGLKLRRAVRAAAEQLDLLDEDAPGLKSDDAFAWETLVDAVTGAIFWDNDWEVDLVEPDDAPDVAERIRDMAGITDDYYSAVPPDPAPAQLAAVRGRLKALCAAPLA